ncbi:MAG: ABC transporter substrate-binding protein [Hyphomicrobiales bacterium]
MKLDDMFRLAARGKISRRDFVQLSVAGGLTLAAGEAMFARAARAEPKKGGFFRCALGHGNTKDTLDPATWNNAFDGDIGQGLIGNMLVQINTKNGVEPDLAESFEQENGAKTWVFRLRKGVTFHNGKSLEAEDVIASYRHHMGPDSKSAAKSILAIVDDIKADGKDTVVFTLKSGSADFPYLTSDYHLPILPSKDGKMQWEKAEGTGPFILEAFEPGVRAKGRRNPNYHRDVWFDEVEMLSILDVAARTNALVTGEVQYIDRPDLKTLAMLKRNGNLEVDNITGFAHFVAPMITTMAPFDNADVRRALKWSIDRQALVDKILLGYGKPGNDNPIAPSVKFATNPAPVHTLDPDKAKFHLKKAGLSSLKVDLSVSDAAFAGAVDAGVLMQDMAAKCGIEINVVREGDDSYWDTVWMKKPWCMSFWGGRPTADWMFTTAYAPDAAWNETAWKNPRFDELLLAARAETDEAKRAPMYAEMQDLVHDDGGVAVLMFNDWVSVHSKKVAHGDLNSNYDHDGGHLYQRWWFA